VIHLLRHTGNGLSAAFNSVPFKEAACQKQDKIDAQGVFYGTATLRSPTHFK
jgi:hypothetical protein